LKLSKKALKEYRHYLSEEYPICQDEDCSNLADNHHHCFFGCYGSLKDDRYLINLCLYHHQEAHKHKHEMQERYKDIAYSNWQEFTTKIKYKEYK